MKNLRYIFALVTLLVVNLTSCTPESLDSYDVENTIETTDVNTKSAFTKGDKIEVNEDKD